MTLDEHFKSNANILKDFKRNKDEKFKILGPYVWTHEVCSLEKDYTNLKDYFNCLLLLKILNMDINYILFLIKDS